MISKSSISRRRMLGYSLATMSLGLMSPALAKESHLRIEGNNATSSSQRCVVVVDLVGGNDGFNTVIPYRDPDYAILRPGIAIPRNAVLELNNYCGLHPALAPLMSTWDAGQLAVLHGLGISETNGHESARAGWRGGHWLGKGLLATVSGTLPVGVTFAGGAGPLTGCDLSWSCLDQAEQFPDFIISTNQTAAEMNAELHARVASTSVAGNFPNTRLGQELAQSARLLVSGAIPATIVVTHEGYDTHKNQSATHGQLMADLGQSLAAFREALLAVGRWQDVLVVTSSEFGRDPRENLTGGTEHGAASVHFALGGAVRGGAFGEMSHIGRGIPSSTASVHQIYSAVAQDFQNLGITTRRVDPAGAFARVMVA